MTPKRLFCLPCSNEGRLPDEYIAQLRQHGMTFPMRGISDPRLSYPELLITDGWERFDVPDGYGYKYTTDETPDGQMWQQTFVAHEDGDRSLTTQCGQSQITISRDGNGQITVSTKP
ncbi:MAG: hypothetical protein ACYCW6_14235 [Candidatus Xenobia bacterium]